MSTRKLALYEDDTRAWGLIEADALMTLAGLPDHSVDAVVCDPPYAIDFGGESWDGADIRRVAGPEVRSGGEAFQSWTTTWAVEAKRVLKPGGHLVAFGAPRTFHRTVSGIEDGGLEIRDVLMWLYGTGVPKSRRLPDGMATTLKPAYEPALLARTPLEGATARNLETWGTGALNTEAAGIGQDGYWPANVALSHAPDCPVQLIDHGTPSRLFYCSKATRPEREAGCEQLPKRKAQIFSGHHHKPRIVSNVHPTVKPLALMRWLVRLVTPTDGVVLDPFTGSGSTGIAAVLEGRTFLGIERKPEYVDVACARLTHWAHKVREA
ncbi:MAG: DNA-methyltransferase [Arthrospira platensis]